MILGHLQFLFIKSSHKVAHFINAAILIAIYNLLIWLSYRLIFNWQKVLKIKEISCILVLESILQKVRLISWPFFFFGPYLEVQLLKTKH
jgi:hypothetical protein